MLWEDEQTPCESSNMITPQKAQGIATRIRPQIVPGQETVVKVHPLEEGGSVLVRVQWAVTGG